MSGRLSALLSLLSLILMMHCSDDPQPEILPEISNIDPASGSYDMWVTIQGNNLGSTPSDDDVRFNGKQAVILSVSPGSVTSPFATQMKVMVPRGAGTGPVTITVGGKTGIGPTFTYIEPENTSYFITFKVDGVLQEFQNMDSSYANCSKCSCHNIVRENGDFVGLSVCRSNLVTSKMILELKGKTLPLRDNADYPFAEFFYFVGSQLYASNDLDNLNSYMTIDDVVYNGSHQGYNTYNVSGTFEGVIENADSDDFSTITVTEGKFLIRFSAAQPG